MPRTKRKALFDKMVAQCSLLSSQWDDWTSNRDNLIIAWRDISLHNGHAAQLDEKIVTKTMDSYERGKKDATKLPMYVRFSRVIHLDQLQNYCAGRSGQYPELEADTSALNLLLSKAREQGAEAFTHQLGQNRLFWRPDHVDLVPALNLLAMRSYTFSIRAVMGIPLLNINRGMSAVYKPGYVLEYYNMMLHNTAKQQCQIERHLKGLRVRIMYTRGASDDAPFNDATRRTRTIAEICFKRADQVFFDKEKDSKAKPISVWQYMRDTYPNIIKDKGSPSPFCVNLGETGKPTWFLPEHLWVLPNQVYRPKLTGDQTTKMLEHASLQPEQNRHAILTDGIGALGITPNDDGIARVPKALRDSGISLTPKMLEVPARQSPSPNVTYNSGAKVDLSQGKWTNRGQKFVNTAKSFNGDVQFFVAGKQLKFSDAEQVYIAAFRTGINNLGIKTATGGPIRVLGGIIPLNTNNRSTILKSLTDIGNKKQIGLFVLIMLEDSKESRRTYADFKSVAEQDLGVRTLVFNEARMRGSVPKRARGQPCNAGLLAGYMANIAMKLNSRLGNTNHALPVRR